MTEPGNNSAARTRDWRARRRSNSGGLVQVIAWVPREYATPLRKIFALLGDPDWPGAAYRSVVAPWLYRRRPVVSRLAGHGYTIEIDAPQIDNDRELLPIGGRVFGADHTFVELTPIEAAELNKNIQLAVAQVAQEFIKNHGLDGHLRDRTGVLLPEVAPHHAGYRPANLQAYDVDRPETDQQFAAREAAVSREIFDCHDEVAISDVSEDLYEIRYVGGNGMPSRAIALVGKKGNLDRTIDGQSNLIALIGLTAGGTPPTLKFALLVKVLREKLLKDDDGSLRCLDVEPNEFSPAAALRVAEVKLSSDQNSVEWLPNPKIPLSLNRRMRLALEDYRGWRERGRLRVEDEEALASLGDGGASV